MTVARVPTAVVDERPRGSRVADLGVVPLLLAAHLAVLGLAAVGLPVPLLQIPLGLAVVLVLPGYAMSVAAFPSSDDLTDVERVGLSIAMSLGAIAPLALVLDALPWRLQPSLLALGLYAVTLGALIVALARQMRSVGLEGAPGTVDAPGRRRGLLSGLRRPSTLLVLAALLVPVVGSAPILTPTRDVATSAFYVLGPGGLIGGFPYRADEDRRVGVTLGVVNDEARVVTYRVEAWVVQEENRPNVRIQVLDGSPFELAPGQQREWTATWQMPVTASLQRVELLLLRDGSGEASSSPYRALTLWIEVPESAPS